MIPNGVAHYFTKPVEIQEMVNLMRGKFKTYLTRSFGRVARGLRVGSVST